MPNDYGKRTCDISTRGLKELAGKAIVEMIHHHDKLLVWRRYSSRLLHALIDKPCSSGNPEAKTFQNSGAACSIDIHRTEGAVRASKADVVAEAQKADTDIPQVLLILKQMGNDCRHLADSFKF